MNIFVYDKLPEDARRLLEAEAPRGVHITYAAGETVAPEAFLNAEIVFGNVPRAWLRQTHRLRWLQLASHGYTGYPEAEAPAGMTLTNLGDLLAEAVAASALAGILAFYRDLPHLMDLQRRREWLGHEVRPRMRLLSRSKVVITGSGTIARALKQMLTGLGGQALTMGRTRGDLLGQEALDRELPSADVLVNVLPENEATIGFFNRRRLELLPRHALFVNVGRGSAVDEDSLLAMLRAGRLHGAVLDVTREEPLPAEHPFWAMPNVLLTQHTGGGYDGEKRDMVRLFLDNLGRYTMGEALRFEVER